MRGDVLGTRGWREPTAPTMLGRVSGETRGVASTIAGPQSASNGDPVPQRPWPLYLTNAAVALALLAPTPLPAQRAYRIGPPAAWVRPIPAPVTASASSRPVTEGYEMLLIDQQEAVQGPSVERFKHLAYRLLDDGAVQDNSQIEIAFDPSYEQLILHTAIVRRNGRSIDQLHAGRIRVVQREKEMDYQIYSGSLSVVVLLEDVRRGDVIEYSYTRRGANPVFAGHYMSEVVLQRTVPVRRLSFRLLWPRERSLFVRPYLTALEPVVRDTGALREYVWSDTALAPKVLDADLPSWYDPLPEIQLSDFASWSQVAAWGDSLFAVPARAPAELAAPLAAIRASDSTAAGRVLRALRFVQEEVRYLGIEIGANSHRPYAPAVVMRRRYGDCKDKALLLITMLRELGIQARPALVSTEYGGHVGDFEPTAQLFDHAIVRAEVDGRAVWVDPTALYERGDLQGAAPPFGAALVLGGAADSLSAIPQPPGAGQFTDVSVSFELHTVGAPVEMRVDTRYTGGAANDVRASVRAKSAEELQRRYTDFYAEAYPSIRALAPPEVHDDEGANVIRTVERYSIPEFWHPSSDQDGYVGTFDALELARVVPTTGAGARTMPLGVDYPVHVRYRIEARLPQGWAISARDRTIETPAVRFAYHVKARGDVLTLSYEYETLSDNVQPDAVADHLAKISQVRKLLAFTVTPPDTTAASSTWGDPDQLNWTVLLVALLTAVAAVFAAIRLYRAPPPDWPRGPEGSEAEPKGLGGWLVLVGIGVSITPLFIVLSLVRTGPTYAVSTWVRLTTPGGGAYNAFWAPTLLFELVGNVTLLVFGCLQLWTFFRRKRLFPALFVIFVCARVVVSLVDTLLAQMIPAVDDRAELNWETNLRALLYGVLWTAYMFRSRRVKNTFVE